MRCPGRIGVALMQKLWRGLWADGIAPERPSVEAAQQRIAERIVIAEAHAHSEWTAEERIARNQQVVALLDRWMMGAELKPLAEIEPLRFRAPEAPMVPRDTLRPAADAVLAAETVAILADEQPSQSRPMPHHPGSNWHAGPRGPRFDGAPKKRARPKRGRSARKRKR